MSIKSILVHVDERQHVGSHLDTAVLLARQTGARLVGAYLVPTGDMTPSLAALLPQEVVTRRMSEASEAQERAKVAFLDAAKRGGLDRTEWRAPAGYPLRAALVAHGRYSDLVVFGQRRHGDPLASFTSELVSEALFDLGRPVLIVPFTGAQPTLGSRILIATNGGREATRAVGDAMALIEQASEVRVLLGSSDGDMEQPSFAATSARLAGWLGDHGVEPSIERFEAISGDHGEWLLSRAADYGSDLIVMGGYGHARVREWVLGGMTRTILRSLTVPVLMSH